MANESFVEQALENHEFDPYSSGWNFWYYEVEEDEIERVPGLGDVTVIEKQMAGEGDYAAKIYIVFKVEAAPDVYSFFKKEGNYASYDGSSWDGSFKEVRPTEKTILVYE